MGMASSQARLLSLTSRQHSIELKAQVLQAQKLQLANDSDAAYNNYVKSLDATRLQTKLFNKDGKQAWVDASVNNLMRINNPEMYGNTFFVKNVDDGKIYLPKSVADKYEAADGNLGKFLAAYGQNGLTEKEVAKKKLDEDIANGWNVEPNPDDFKITNNPYSAYLADANNVKNILSRHSNSTNTDNKLTNEDFDNLKISLSNIMNCNLYKDNADLRQICITAFADIPTDLPDCSSAPSSSEQSLGGGVKLVTTHTYSDPTYIFTSADGKSASLNEECAFGEKVYFNGADRVLMYLSSAYIEVQKECTETKQVIDEYGNVQSEEPPVTELVKSSIRQTYLPETRIAIYNYLGINSDSIGPLMDSYGEHNIAEVLTKITNELLSYESSGISDEYNKAYANYLTYLRDLEAYNSASDTKLGQYDNSITGNYYENLFKMIQLSSGYHVISSAQAKDGDWVNSMARSGKVVLSIYDAEENEMNDYSAFSHHGLQEVTNESEMAVADVEYENELDAINSKELKISRRLSRLETERAAIKTEIDSIKQIRNDNINVAFKVFG